MDCESELTKAQAEKFNTWRKLKHDSLDDKDKFDSNKLHCFSFSKIPTGIGNLEIIKCSDGTELDVTEYEHW